MFFIYYITIHFYRSLDSSTAFNNGQHLFANLVQRVNDSFSADNPDCQATLTGCLRLIQSLLTDHSTLPLTFMSKCINWNECEEFDSASLGVQIDDKHVNKTSNLFTRQLHISGERVRELLGWSGSGDQGKPVRDLHALLEVSIIPAYYEAFNLCSKFLLRFYTTHQYINKSLHLSLTSILLFYLFIALSASSTYTIFHVSFELLTM